MTSSQQPAQSPGALQAYSIDAPLPPLPGADGSDESSLLDWLIVLGRHRRLVVLGPLAAAVIAAGVSLVLPKSYTATARILPPQQGQSTAAAMLSQLGGLASVTGGALGIKNPSDLYIGMLKSATVGDALVARFRLKELFHAEYQVLARRALANRTTILAGKDGIIGIDVEARDPKLAADLANAYVEELHNVTSNLAVTEAGQRRLFFERQLQQAKERLADAEVKLRQAMDTGGFASVDAQGRTAVETVARVRASISVKEIQIGAMRAYATPENAEMRRAEQELAALRAELARLESGAPRPGSSEGAGPTDPKGIANVRLLRELKYQEVLFELLAKQYELARIDESKEAPVVQVLDRATVPELRSKPKRAQMVVATYALALLLALGAVYVLESLASARSEPASRGRLEALRGAWWPRRR